ncbi:MAG: helix-hairpin-helix domain-containing protein [Burkholderiales bacterium]|nr:helix-hairpin-helix domain-containing protein [Burkholderiales bacterium]
MSFSEEERTLLLGARGLGPAVIERLEEVGVDSVDRLTRLGAEAAVAAVCAHLGTRAWTNRLRALQRFCRDAEGRRRSASRPTP